MRKEFDAVLPVLLIGTRADAEAAKLRERFTAALTESGGGGIEAHRSKDHAFIRIDDGQLLRAMYASLAARIDAGVEASHCIGWRVCT